MSTFNGMIEELDDVCVDNFESQDNLEASIYFLSHCHSDHMKGLFNMLTSNEFQSRDDVYLYGSPITVTILTNMNPNVKNKVRALGIGMEHYIKNPKTSEEICVTLLPAGHCPGSVMFLFEIEKRILYTGDIRLSVNEFKECKSLKTISGNVKKIDKLYLDTTFLKKSFLNFPNRKESVEEFVNLTKNWLEKSDNQVNYHLSGRYGTEYLIIEAAKELKMPFHVSELNFNTYKCIPEMDKSVTLDGKKTRIHASCHLKDYNKVCYDLYKLNQSNSNKILTVKTSIQRWENKDFQNGIIEKYRSNNYFIAYSSHCSFNELKDIIYYLKPGDIYPCVIPEKELEKTEMMNVINEMLEDIHKDKENKEKVFKKTNWLLPDADSESSEKDSEDPFEYFDKPKKQKIL